MVARIRHDQRGIRWPAFAAFLVALGLAMAGASQRASREAGALQVHAGDQALRTLGQDGPLVRRAGVSAATPLKPDSRIQPPV